MVTLWDEANNKHIYVPVISKDFDTAVARAKRAAPVAEIISVTKGHYDVVVA